MPDYDLADELVLETLDQLRALASPARRAILRVLSDQAASGQELARMLGASKGAVGHHLKVLRDAGLVQVVRRRRVRGVTERSYGRAAKVFRVSADGLDGEFAGGLPAETATLPLRQALEEAHPVGGRGDPSVFAISHARIPRGAARAFARRVEALVREFGAQAETGDELFGLVAGVYRAERATIDEREQ